MLVINRVSVGEGFSVPRVERSRHLLASVRQRLFSVVTDGRLLSFADCSRDP